MLNVSVHSFRTNLLPVSVAAEVMSWHFVKAAVSVNLGFHATNQDQSPPKGSTRSGVSPSQVPRFFCRVGDMHDSSDVECCLSFQRLKPRSRRIEAEKEKGDEDMRKRVCGGGGVIDRLWLRWFRAR